MLDSKVYFIYILLLIGTVNCFSQEEESLIVIDTTDVQIEQIIKPTKTSELDPLSPSRAAFYSAVLPGLGQAYNRKYWKIPIIYAALGTGVYFYIDNSDNYDRARTAFKLNLAGKPHEFDGQNGNILLSEEALVRAQKGYKKDRDLSLLITVAMYLLQVLEASTNAHLLQHNVDSDLSIRPQLIQQPINNNAVVGASINFKF